MTVLNRNPSNPNMYQPNKFQLNFARIPNIQYFCQMITLPGISTSEIPVNNPFVELYAPGEKAIYDVLNITFLVDMELKAWLEVHDWLRALTFPTEYEEYQNLANANKYTTTANSPRPQYSDGSVTLLSAANVPYFKINFIDLFPISLSGFTVSATDSPESIITADATFRFAYFNVEKLIKTI